jgi:hypothetical protein
VITVRFEHHSEETQLGGMSEQPEVLARVILGELVTKYAR